MRYDRRYKKLINKIILAAIHLRLRFCRKINYQVLKEKDYEKIQKIKQLLAQLEELDTVPRNNNFNRI